MTYVKSRLDELASSPSTVTVFIISVVPKSQSCSQVPDVQQDARSDFRMRPSEPSVSTNTPSSISARVSDPNPSSCSRISKKRLNTQSSRHMTESAPENPSGEPPVSSAWTGTS